MASQGSSTRVRTPPPAAPPPLSPGGGLELSTLMLSAIASAVAAYVTSRVWAKGTLVSAAMSPVIVALVKEGLRRPTEVVTSAVPPVRGRRRDTVAETLPDDMAEQFAQGAPPTFPPPEPGAAAGPVRVYSTRGRRLRWRLAVVTGLLGFAACVLFYTVPELITGQSVGSSARHTTLWGGSTRHHTSKQGTSSTTTSTQITTTKTQTTPAVTTPTKTVTVPAPSAAPTSTTPGAPAAPQTAQPSSATP